MSAGGAAALTAHGAPLASWLAYWKLKSWYHRFETHGLEHLAGPDSVMIVGYHGRPVAYDLCMLSVTMHERLGHTPHAVFHASFGLPLLSWYLEGLGGVTRDDERLVQVVERGEHLLVLPGGTREAHRSWRQRYKVDWGRRTGYLRLAIKLGIPIVPVGASGVDSAYFGLADGYALARRLGLPPQVPLWAGVGPGGLWPFSPPFPVKIRQLIGEPITATADGSIDAQDQQALHELHGQVADTVQSLIRRARAIS